MRLLSRTAGVASRRLGRPELLAAVDAGARRVQRETVAVSALLAGVLGGEGTYVDVGANRGQVLREAVRVAPRARHVAFEPIPGLAAELQRAFPAVDCRARALGAQAGRSEFCHFRALDGWSGLQRRPEISDRRGDPQLIAVEVSTLDIELAGGPAPRVVKIDVEGAEVAVLEGAREILTRARPLVMFEHQRAAAALYGAPAEEPWRLLVDLGYQIFALTGEGPFACADFVGAAGIVNWLATPLESKVNRFRSGTTPFGPGVVPLESGTARGW